MVMPCDSVAYAGEEKKKRLEEEIRGTCPSFVTGERMRLSLKEEEVVAADGAVDVTTHD